MSEPVYERRAELLEAELGDELVALDAKAGNCFGFNSVATSIWRQLASPKSLAEIREALLAEYDVGSEQCTEELGELLDSLVEKGLVQVRVATRGPQ